MATAVSRNDSSWVASKSYQSLTQRLSNNYSNNFHFYNSPNSSMDTNNKLFNKRIDFVKPSNPNNARPSTSSSHGSSKSSTSSTNSSKIDVVNGRQRSEFNFPKRHLFEEAQVQKIMKWPRELSNNPAGAGLRNLGNSCFMNASLQCICYTPPLQNYLKSGHHGSRCRIRGFCAFCEIQNLFPQMVRATRNMVGTPSNIFHNLPHFSRMLRKGRQEDAHEFIIPFLDSLQMSALKSEGQKIKDPRIQETSVIHKIFGGYLRSQVKCCKCGNESNTYDAILDISLELKGCNTVDAALKHYTSDEILDGDNKYFCSRCKKKRRAHKKLSIFEPPNVLILHLKRFEYGTGMSGMSGFGSKYMYGGYYRGGYGGGGGGGGRQGKIDKHVKFNETLDITHLQSYHTSPRVSYSLYGVLIHHGRSSNSGHYTSYVKAANGTWSYMDDSSVHSARVSEVLNSSAYILFYVRNEDKVPYKSPGLTPKNTFVVPGGTGDDAQEFDLNSIKNMLPNQTPAILQLSEKNNSSDRPKSLNGSSILSDNNASNVSKVPTTTTTTKSNETDSKESIVKYASVKAAAPDAIDADVLVGGKRSNKSVLDETDVSGEPPQKRRRMSSQSSAKMSAVSAMTANGINFDMEESSKRVVNMKNMKNVARMANMRNRRGGHMNSMNSMNRMNNENKMNAHQVILSLKQKRLKKTGFKVKNIKKQQQKQKIKLNKSNNFIKSKISKSNDKNNNNTNIDNTGAWTTRMANNGDIPNKSNKSSAVSNRSNSREKSIISNNGNNGNNAANSHESDTGDSILSILSNGSLKSSDDSKSSSSPSSPSSPKYPKTSYNESNQSNGSKSRVTSASLKFPHDSSISSNTSKISKHDSNESKSSSKSSKTSIKSKISKNDESIGKKVILGHDGSDNISDAVGSSSEPKQLKKLKNESKSSSKIVSNDNKIDSNLNKMDSKPLQASKKDIFEYLHGTQSGSKKNGTQSGIFGNKVNLWEDAAKNESDMINVRNEAIFEMNELEKSYIGEKDEWEAGIDMDRTQERRKKKKGMKERWKEFNKLKHKNGFEALQRGVICKRKKFIKFNKHKKRMNRWKQEKRARKVQ